jgi:hypothetical protein
MTTNPQTFPVVRDYLYVDLTRVRSLLAQLADGAPELATEHSNRLSSISARLAFGPLASVDASRNRGTDVEERRP